jgi:hypothetical protein
MKATYEKPGITSERVFAMTSQACDVNLQVPGACSHMKYTGECPFPYKILDRPCGEPPANPRQRS